MNNIGKLLKTKKTVFRKRDIANILDFRSEGAIDKFLYRAKRSWDILHIQRWIYVLDDYDKKELSCKLRQKSYISLETVLLWEGIIFQHYDTIFSVSDDSRVLNVDDWQYSYSKIHDDILLNPLGIYHKNNYSIASKERAVCDKLYLSSGYYFDNLEGIDFEKLEQISKIYNKRLQKEIISLRHVYETQ